MRKGRHSSIFVLAAVLALLALGAGYEESFFHTDDGCAVEIHCLACRLVVAGTAVATPAVDLVPRAALVSALAPTPDLAERESAPRTFEPRGPPLA